MAAVSALRGEIMSQPYRCLRYRSVTALRSQQLRRASFVSLGNLVDGIKSGKGLSFDRDDGPGGTKGLVEPNYPVKTSRKHQDPRLENLFSGSISRKDKTSQEQPSTPNQKLGFIKTVPARTLVDEDIRTLKHLHYERRASLIEMWKATQELLGSSNWQQMILDAGDKDAVVFPAAQLKIFGSILVQVAHTRSRHPKRAGLPSVANVIQAYRRHNVMKFWWDEVLWSQLTGYILMSPYHVKRAVVKEDLATVLGEIIDVWRLLIREYGERLNASPIADENKSNQLSMASFSKSSGKNARWGRLFARLDTENPVMPSDISQRFSEYWPRYPATNIQNKRMVIACIMTFDCLKRAERDGFAKDSIMDDLEILTRFLAPLVQGGEISWGSAVKRITKEDIPRITAERIVNGWEGLSIKVVEAPSPCKASQTSQAAQQGTLSTPIMSDASTKMTSALSVATQKADAALVNRLWQDFQRQVNSDTIEGPHRDELFCQFLSAFFTLRYQAEAVEVWNFMINTDHEPTLKHWNAMLAGCTAAKDLSSLREIQSNMVNSGIKFDIKIWTSWIHGLMACGDWQAGLNALEDLGKTWKPGSLDGDETSPPQLVPSVIPVRAALTGLAQSDNLESANAVLRWAKKQNLTLDTHIYNIILRPAIRANDEAKVQSILNIMQANDCRPDIATFTIMLNGLLSNPSSTFHTRSPFEQQSAVFAILHDMESNGLEPNTYTYSTILDGLLDSKIYNIEAAQAVMAHMSKNNIKPSPHVYTILITHYFSLEPPDLPAIDTLLNRIRQEKTSLDSIFWDRMIESYARVGEIERMLLILRRMPEEGKSPGWMSLLACLRALVEAREWEHVRDLVRDVEAPNGVLRHGSGPWRGKDAFWELIGDLKRDRVMRQMISP